MSTGWEDDVANYEVYNSELLAKAKLSEDNVNLWRNTNVGSARTGAPSRYKPTRENKQSFHMSDLHEL